MVTHVNQVDIITTYTMSFSINPNSLDNKSSWRILKDFYCSVRMPRELGLKFVVLLYLNKRL